MLSRDHRQTGFGKGRKVVHEPLTLQQARTSSSPEHPRKGSRFRTLYLELAARCVAGVVFASSFQQGHIIFGERVPFLRESAQAHTELTVAVTACSVDEVLLANLKADSAGGTAPGHRIESHSFGVLGVVTSPLEDLTSLECVRSRGIAAVAPSSAEWSTNRADTGRNQQQRGMFGLRKIKHWL